jgi:hypothetical protein
MKPKSILSLSLVAGLLLAIAGGCSTTKQTVHTEELLVSSGFKEVTAATPAQLAKLQALRPGKITPVKRDGKTWYVYPDAAHHKFYVGSLNQFEAYRQAYQDDQLVKQQFDSVLLYQDTVDWSAGTFGDFGN